MGPDERQRPGSPHRSGPRGRVADGWTRGVHLRHVCRGAQTVGSDGGRGTRRARYVGTVDAIDGTIFGTVRGQRTGDDGIGSARTHGVVAPTGQEQHRRSIDVHPRQVRSPRLRFAAHWTHRDASVACHRTTTSGMERIMGCRSDDYIRFAHGQCRWWDWRTRNGIIAEPKTSVGGSERTITESIGGSFFGH